MILEELFSTESHHRDVSMCQSVYVDVQRSYIISQ